MDVFLIAEKKYLKCGGLKLFLKLKWLAKRNRLISVQTNNFTVKHYTITDYKNIFGHRMFYAEEKFIDEK